MSTADPSIALLPIGSEAPRLRPTPRRGVHASVHLEPNLNPSSVLGAEFLRAWLEGPRPYLRSQRLARPTVPSDALPDGSTVLRCATSDVGVEVLAQAGPCLVLIDSRIGGSFIQVIAPDDELASSFLDQVAVHADDPPGAATEIQMWWWRGEGRSNNVKREIHTPGWASIARNYPTSVRKKLHLLMALGAMPLGGRLILWHGPPGTGKTTALRALVGEWAGWCDANYVTDPERLFGEAAYLAEILTSASRRRGGPTLTSAGSPSTPARLIIAEDSDEYLRATARRDAGAALGRLLNTTDGMLAQGCDAIVLITTNEDLGRIHPAITRPGRCLAAVEFTPFSPAQAGEWLSSSPTNAPVTLAELLARSGELGDQHGEPSAPIRTGTYL